MTPPAGGPPASAPFIIAELGTAHGGSLARAKELIDAARESGADCVKFQIVYAAEILHPDTGVVPLPGGDTPLYEVFKKLEAPPAFFAELKAYAESGHTCFLATPFGPKSAAELKRLSPACVKIASPELNYTQLLREAGSWGVPVYLSAGVSTLAGIEEALALLREARGPDPLAAPSGSVPPDCLLHCVTAYPAPEEEYNLNLLPALSGIFGIPCGLSDHSLDPCLAPLLAVCRGAAIIEKHFCLSRTDGGLDDPIAQPPAAFARMAREARAAFHTLSAAQDRDAARETLLADIARVYGRERVAKALGSGRKELAPSERANYGRTNRSVHARAAIKRGETFTAQNLAVLRTEKVLRPGLPPCFLERLIGRPARNDIPSGEGVRFEDV